MITQVEIIDFLSHRDTTLKFDSGMNVIVGSNGTGKSSVVDAITFALFGEHTRGVKDALVRHGTTGGYTRVKFNTAQRDFEITRKIKTGSPVILREQKDGVWSNISAGERKQMGESTKREVEEILGMDFEELQIASIIRQGELDKIVHDSPKVFKTRINNIIGLDILDEAHEQMGNLIEKFRANIRKRQGYDDTHLSTLDAKISESTASLQEAKAQTESLGESKVSLESKVSELNKQFNAIKETANAQEQWDKRIAELNQYVQTVRSNATSEITRCSNAITECKTALENTKKGAGVKVELESLKQILESAESEINVCKVTIASLNEKLNMSEKLALKDGKCPVCNSQVSKLNPLFVATHIKEEINKTNNNLDAQRAVAAESKQKITTMKEIENSITVATETLRIHAVNDKKDIEQMEQKIIALRDMCDAASSCISGDWEVAGRIDQQAQTYCDELAALKPKVSSQEHTAYR